jgi:hypothetical protein
LNRGFPLPSVADPEQRRALALLVGEFSRRVAELSPGRRHPFVYENLGRLRVAYRDSLLRDTRGLLEADNFVDFLEDWIWATVGMIESEASEDATAS